LDNAGSLNPLTVTRERRRKEGREGGRGGVRMMPWTSVPSNDEGGRKERREGGREGGTGRTDDGPEHP